MEPLSFVIAFIKHGLELELCENNVTAYIKYGLFSQLCENMVKYVKMCERLEKGKNIIIVVYERWAA